MNNNKLAKASDLDIHYGDDGPLDFRYRYEHPSDFIYDAIDRRMDVALGKRSSATAKRPEGRFPCYLSCSHRAGVIGPGWKI